MCFSPQLPDVWDDDCHEEVDHDQAAHDGQAHHQRHREAPGVIVILVGGIQVIELEFP